MQNQCYHTSVIAHCFYSSYFIGKGADLITETYFQKNNYTFKSQAYGCITYGGGPMGSHVLVATATVLDIWVNPISYMHPQTTTYTVLLCS